MLQIWANKKLPRVSKCPMGENSPNLVTLFSIPFIISALVESIEKCTYAFQNVGDLEQKHKREKKPA
jgi:hypothetical protein